jgi:hypothetical protein
MNYTTRRKRSNNKKTRKHRGGINWKFWEKTAPAQAAPAPAEVVENKCPPCPVCAQAQQAQAQQAQAQAQQAQAMQEPAMPDQSMPMQAPAMPTNEGSMMSGGKRRRGRKSSRKNRKSKKWFQMGCKSMF